MVDAPTDAFTQENASTQEKKNIKLIDDLPALHAVHETLDMTLFSISNATCCRLNSLRALSKNGE